MIVTELEAQLARVNTQLREQNRVLREALLKVRPELYCMDKQLIASGYKRGVSVADAMKALEAALTATSQPAKLAGKMHACDIPGCVSCGNPEDATTPATKGGDGE